MEQIAELLKAIGEFPPDWVRHSHPSPPWPSH